MDGVERVMVLGIFIVIVLILGVLAWDASHEDPAAALASEADGGSGADAARFDPRSELARDGSVFDELEAARRRAAVRNPAGDDTDEAPAASPPADGSSRNGGPPAGRGRPAARPGQAPADGADPRKLAQDTSRAQAALGGEGAADRAGWPPALSSSVPLQPQPAAAAQPRTYVVKEGDTAWRIVAAHFGAGDRKAMVDAVQDLNPDVDLEVLQVGQRLVLPREAPPEAVLPTPEQRAAAGEGRTYKVQEGDTLHAIAAAQLGDGRRWQEIYDANRHLIDSPSRLSVGVTLVLPER